VAKDSAPESRQLIQRGFDHYEHGRVPDALSDWETALRLDPRHAQAKRLVTFARQRVAELEAGEHPSPSRRDTVESPIPQFLAALTERKSDKVTVPTVLLKDVPTAKILLDARETSKHDESLMADQRGPVEQGDEASSASLEEELAPDTLEDLPVNAEDVRASTNELVGECRAALSENRAESAALAAEVALQLAERGPPPGVDDLIEPSRAMFERAFRALLGNPHGCPIRAIPTEDISENGLAQRAAFLMSRLDGMTSIADLIDSSGMPRFDAVRVLASLRRAKAIDMLPPLP
jgi:hypothetical protein